MQDWLLQFFNSSVECCIFINDPEEGINRALITFADDTKLRDAWLTGEKWELEGI